MSVPSVFGLPHLSEDAVAAFADGVLAPAAAARATRHCRECEECAEAVRGQREAVFLLRSAIAPSLPSGLLDRLAGLPMSAELPPPTSGLPTTLDTYGNPVFIAHGLDPLAGRRAPGDEDRFGTDPSADAHGAGDLGAHDFRADLHELHDLHEGFVPRSDAPHRRGFAAHPRTAIPLGLLASVAVAVTAVGAFGSQSPTFGTGPNNSANLSGAIPSGQRHDSNARPLGSRTATPGAAPVRLPSGTSAVSYLRSGTGPIVPSASGTTIGRP